MIIREERYGRPAASRLLFPTLRGVKFRTNSGNFHFPVLFPCKFKAAFPRGLRLHAKYATNFSPITSPFLPHDDPSLSPVMAQDLREKREKAIRMKQPYFQSLNNQEWEEIVLSYHKWHSLKPLLKPSFRRLLEMCISQVCIIVGCAYVSRIKWRN